MKKTLIWIFTAVVVLGAAAVTWGIILFKGNAVKQSTEIYLSKRSDYTTLLDSLKPKIDHHLAFDIYAKVITSKRDKPLRLRFASRSAQKASYSLCIRSTICSGDAVQ